MGIVLLKEQGKLKYEDSLRHFFPELPYSNISIRQLLQHTSGLPDYMDLVLEHTIVILVMPYWPVSLKKYPVRGTLNTCKKIFLLPSG